MPVPTLSIERQHGSPDLTKGSHGNHHHHHKKRKGVSKHKTDVVVTSHLNSDLQLSEAVTQGKSRVVKRLLDSRANPNHTNEAGQTPLMLACSIQDDESRKTIFQLLLRKGADVNLQDVRGLTVLMSAIQVEDEGTIHSILSHGYNVQLADVDGNNALSYASATGNEQLVQTLVRAFKRQRASIDLQNHQGLTPLLIACQEGHLEVARILVNEGGASPTIRDLDHFMNAQEWMNMSGFFTEEQLAFLSPSGLKRSFYRKQRQMKGIRTLQDCLLSHDHIEGNESPNVFSLRRKSLEEERTHLPDLPISSKHRLSHKKVTDGPKSMFGVASAKSMFDVPMFSMTTKTPGYALGCPVPQKPSSHSKNPFQTVKGDLYSSSYLTRRKSFLSRNPRSGMYHSGALDPLDDIQLKGQRLTENDPHGQSLVNDKNSSHSNRKGKHDLLPPIKR